MIAPHPRYNEATVLNPDAGHHVVTSAPHEVRAARRAAQRSWAHFPYYGRRYGTRGRQFSLSDSGWLATLCDLPAGAALEQVKWLGRMLSSRGMPQWLLEIHLEHLHEELTKAVPESAGRYDILLRGADALREMREAHFPPAAFDGLASAFEARVGETWTRRLRGMGGILVSAVADERSDIELAVPTLTARVCDAERFPPEWISAVADTPARGRSPAATHSPSRFFQCSSRSIASPPPAPRLFWRWPRPAIPPRIPHRLPGCRWSSRGTREVSPRSTTRR